MSSTLLYKLGLIVVNIVHQYESMKYVNENVKI